jgi:hypothetical protein
VSGSLPAGAAHARPDDRACARCRTSGREINWSEAFGLWLCAECFTAEPSPLSSETAVPRSSFLVPCPTADADGGDAGQEAELEALLRLHNAGQLAPQPVVLPDLPIGASRAEQDVAAFFAVAMGLRLSAGDARDVPFAVRWVAAKVGWPKATVDRALGALVDAGILMRGDVLPPRGQPRGTQCYRPAAVTRTDELAERRAHRRGSPDV